MYAPFTNLKMYKCFPRKEQVVIEFLRKAQNKSGSFGISEGRGGVGGLH